MSTDGVMSRNICHYPVLCFAKCDRSNNIMYCEVKYRIICFKIESKTKLDLVDSLQLDF